MRRERYSSRRVSFCLNNVFLLFSYFIKVQKMSQLCFSPSAHQVSTPSSSSPMMPHSPTHLRSRSPSPLCRRRNIMMGSAFYVIMCCLEPWHKNPGCTLDRWTLKCCSAWCRWDTLLREVSLQWGCRVSWGETAFTLFRSRHLGNCAKTTSQRGRRILPPS